MPASPPRWRWRDTGTHAEATRWASPRSERSDSFGARSIAAARRRVPGAGRPSDATRTWCGHAVERLPFTCHCVAPSGARQLGPLVIAARMRLSRRCARVDSAGLAAAKARAPARSPAEVCATGRRPARSGADVCTRRRRAGGSRGLATHSNAVKSVTDRHEHDPGSPIVLAGECVRRDLGVQRRRPVWPVESSRSGADGRAAACVPSGPRLGT